MRSLSRSRARSTALFPRTPVADDVAVQWLPPEDIANLTAIDYAEWVEIRPGRDWLPAVWLEIENGEVVTIEEQYQP